MQKDQKLEAVWHSKADKMVNNFYGQNWFQFHGQIPIFMINTFIFVFKTDFVMFRPTNFFCRVAEKQIEALPIYINLWICKYSAYS